jgi:hypothetical protein
MQIIDIAGTGAGSSMLTRLTGRPETPAEARRRCLAAAFRHG